MGTGNFITKTATIVAAMGAVAISANAVPLPTINLNVGASGTDVVGETLPGNIGGAGGQGQDESSDVNGMIGLTPGTATTSGIYYYRSLNTFSSLPYASQANDTLASGGGIKIIDSGTVVQITLNTLGYTYLVARYDGQNAGAEVWDIAGYQAGQVIDIPATAAPDSTGTNLVDTYGAAYGITSYSLFVGSTNPPPPSPAPEVASTAVLLGSSLAGLGLLRKQLKRK